MRSPSMNWFCSIALVLASSAAAASGDELRNLDGTRGVLVSARLVDTADSSQAEAQDSKIKDPLELGSADTIVFIHEGQGSGTLDGVPFGVLSPATFAITARGSLADRTSFGDGWTLDHSTASITIFNVGTFEFVTGTRTFVNNLVQIVGFSRSGPDNSDLFDGPTNIAFQAWDMTTPIGPVPGNGVLVQWGFPEVVTSGGVLVFDNDSVQAIFTADFAPLFADGFESGDTSAWSSTVP